MDRFFWIHAHGAATHFPIALVFAAAGFEFAALLVRSPRLRRDFSMVGFYAVIVAALGSVAGVLTGLGLCHWRFFGEGLLAWHHLCVWVGTGLLMVAAVWRVLMKEEASRKSRLFCLILVVLAAAFMAGAGYFGGEMTHS
jgi:uncharacterized membrane protein